MPEARKAVGTARQRDPRYAPLIVALAAFSVAGAAALALSRRGHEGHLGATKPLLEAPSPHYYDYTLNVDLVDLAAPTKVWVTIQDDEGLREVESLRRSPRQSFSVTERAQGERVTWRIYYGERLVKTVTATSDGRVL